MKNKPTTSAKRIVYKHNRPGVHAKKKASKLKSSKNYLKRYNSQGK